MSNSSTTITDLKIMLRAHQRLSDGVSNKAAPLYLCLPVTVWQHRPQMVHHLNAHTGQIQGLHLSPPSTADCLQERSKVEQNRKGGSTS